jgi:hypothetical protein
MILKSTSEIASELNISVRAVLERFRKRGIIAISKGSSSEGLYDTYQIKKLTKKQAPKKKSKGIIIKYYPLKTTETFYIYESKINKTTVDL